MIVSLGIGSAGDVNTRPGKGKSIISFPDSFCVVDLETTGLFSEVDDIIEIGAIKYEAGKETCRFQSLVKPTAEIDDFITELTGITNAMVASAPAPEEILPQFASFVGSLPIIGYNVSFDVRFLYDHMKHYCGTVFSNDYIDLLRMARKLLPDMEHHRLSDMRERFGIQADAHRAIGDCEATAMCLSRFKTAALEQYGSADAFAAAFRATSPLRPSEITGDPTKADPDSPLFGKHCVFTGKLERFTREQAMQIVADLGGINDGSVTKKTNFLILGNNDYCAGLKGGKSSKHKKAEQLKLDGFDIEILPESVFYEMLGE